MKLDRIITNSTSFLSGCLPIALIDFIQVIVFRPENNNWYVEIFAKTFLLFTIISCVVFYVILWDNFKKADTPVIITNLKRKDMFSSGAISYYVLPFISFIGNTLQSTITLAVVIILLLIIFNNNMMFMYTPFLDILGYKVLEGTIIQPGREHEKCYCCQKNIEQSCSIVVKTDRNLFFTGENKGTMKKISGDTVFFKYELKE